jgi:hypothetical protein
MRLDSSGAMHVAYRAGSNGLRYAHSPGGSALTFTLTDLDPAVGFESGYTAIAFGVQEEPHVAYYDGTDGDLEYA